MKYALELSPLQMGLTIAALGVELAQSRIILTKVSAEVAAHNQPSDIKAEANWKERVALLQGAMEGLSQAMLNPIE
jgi:hypothetical protein